MDYQTAGRLDHGWLYILVIIGIVVAILVGICNSLAESLKRVPKDHQKITPLSVWLFMVPLVGIIWSFTLFPQISASLKSYFDSVDDDSVGDCGSAVGIAYSYCWFGNFVIRAVARKTGFGALTFGSCLLAVITLGLLISYISKVNELSNRIPAEAQ